MAGVLASLASLKDSCSLSWQEKSSYEDWLAKRNTVHIRQVRTNVTHMLWLATKSQWERMTWRNLHVADKRTSAREKDGFWCFWLNRTYLCGRGYRRDDYFGGNLHFNFIYQVRRPNNFMSAILSLFTQACNSGRNCFVRLSWLLAHRSLGFDSPWRSCLFTSSSLSTVQVVR